MRVSIVKISCFWRWKHGNWKTLRSDRLHKTALKVIYMRFAMRWWVGELGVGRTTPIGQMVIRLRTQGGFGGLEDLEEYRFRADEWCNPPLTFSRVKCAIMRHCWEPTWDDVGFVKADGTWNSCSGSDCRSKFLSRFSPREKFGIHGIIGQCVNVCLYVVAYVVVDRCGQMWTEVVFRSIVHRQILELLLNSKLLSHPLTIPTHIQVANSILRRRFRFGLFGGYHLAKFGVFSNILQRGVKAVKISCF